MTALLLLAAAASAGLSAPWWLLAPLSLGWLASEMHRWSRSGPAMTQPAEEVIATIYVRAGHLRLRRTP